VAALAHGVFFSDIDSRYHFLFVDAFEGVANCYALIFFFFSSRRRHTRSVSAFLLNRSSDLTLILNTFLFGVIILIANILKRAFSSQLAAKLRNRLLVL